MSVIRVAKEIAGRQRDRLACEGISLFQANEPAGFQTVFHFDPAELERIASRLRG